MYIVSHLLDFYSQAQEESKVAEDQTSPQAKVSEVSETKKAEVQADEPSVSTQVCSESSLSHSDTHTSGLNKTNLIPFFRAKKQVPINLLQAFQKHTLKKHLKCFRQW